MTVEQIAKLLEIVGFLIATGVAGIFLEKRVLGVWGGKSENFFNWLVNILNRINIPSGEISFLTYVIKVPPKQSLKTISHFYDKYHKDWILVINDIQLNKES